MMEQASDNIVDIRYEQTGAATATNELDILNITILNIKENLLRTGSSGFVFVHNKRPSFFKL